MGIEDSVAAKTHSIESILQDLIEQLEALPGGQSTSISHETIADIWDKLKLWAGNIGARQPAESPASVEARLFKAKRVLEQVLDLLNDLHEALEDLLDILRGRRENRHITYENWDGNDDDSSLPETNVPSRVDKDEAQDIVDVASECIRGLLKISILIRKATPRDRFAKALQAENPFIDQFDINYVAERYPKLGRPESTWLCERLGRAITKRRQFLRYSREHGSRIAGNASNDHADAHAIVPSDRNVSRLIDANFGPQAPSAMGTRLSGSNAARTHASTKASTLDIAKLQQLREAEEASEDVRSLVSTASSLQVGNGDSRLQLPRLEEVSKGGTVFECPFCFGIQTFTRESSWKRHAYGDLKAYVCTLGKGECDQQLFSDSRSWFEHELHCHRKQWVCIVCQKGPFNTAELFEGHVNKAHSDIPLAAGQIAMFMNAGQRTVDAIAASECPFCDEWETALREITPLSQSVDSAGLVITVEPMQFRRHVAFHLQQLALFAIPRNISDEESQNSTDQEAVANKSTANARPASSRATSSNAEDEWIPDPPLHVAAARGDIVTVRRLLDEGADVHSRGETWGTVRAAVLSNIGAHTEAMLALVRERGSEDDAELDEPMTCTNCFTQTTSLWRRGPDGQLLCNACGVFLKVHGTAKPSKADMELGSMARNIKVKTRGSTLATADNNENSAGSQSGNPPDGNLSSTPAQKRAMRLIELGSDDGTDDMGSITKDLGDTDGMSGEEATRTSSLNQHASSSPLDEASLRVQLDSDARFLSYIRSQNTNSSETFLGRKSRGPLPTSAGLDRYNRVAAAGIYDRPTVAMPSLPVPGPAVYPYPPPMSFGYDTLQLESNRPPTKLRESTPSFGYETLQLESNRPPTRLRESTPSMRDERFRDIARGLESIDDSLPSRVPNDYLYEYTRPSDLARYDLDQEESRQRTRDTLHYPHRNNIRPRSRTRYYNPPTRDNELSTPSTSRGVDRFSGRRSPTYQAPRSSVPATTTFSPYSDQPRSSLPVDLRQGYMSGDIHQFPTIRASPPRRTEQSPYIPYSSVRPIRLRDSAATSSLSGDNMTTSRISVSTAATLIDIEPQPSREPVEKQDKEQVKGILKTPTQHFHADKLHVEPVKGILKTPTKRFPEEPNPIREGVTPHADDMSQNSVPPGARWTKINRKFVSPEALNIGKERFELRDDFVIVLRILSKEEIQAYANTTAQLRERRRSDLETGIRDTTLR